MENNNKEYMLIKIIPFVKYEKKEINGKKQIVRINNLKQDEINNMSYEARMIWKYDGDIYYPAELPLTLRGQDVTAESYCAFLYDELTEEEQIKYADRVVVIKSLTDKAVKVYGEDSKRIFGKIRRRVNK